MRMIAQIYISWSFAYSFLINVIQYILGKYQPLNNVINTLMEEEYSIIISVLLAILVTYLYLDQDL
jgi:hypothetical protein